jgi:acetylornithine/succinyldiaminopimelate/putrescine aminotransferase
MATAIQTFDNNILSKLAKLRAAPGKVLTKGLPDSVLEKFARTDGSLSKAVDEALAAHALLLRQHPKLMATDEADQIATLQQGIVNFYAVETVNPYVALAARGPWIITTKGAVIHDSGGYGMLGQGHAPESVLIAMSQPHVMANIMTPNFSQMRLVNALREEIGHTRRTDACDFDRFVFMNSGSEAVTVGARISDINAREMTDPGGRYQGRTIRKLALQGGFHGRTDRPARYSDSTRKTYSRYLASFRDNDKLWTVPPNDEKALRKVFVRAEEEGVFIESMFVEPVMGEGNPGLALTRGFYDAARELTLAHGSLLLVDSIQAGLRAHGVLSVLDYPDFGDALAPDMETYSKALNAGQFPMSVLALTARAASLYRRGVYGNTMTANPRALEVAIAVLKGLSPGLRRNITERGEEFREKLRMLAEETDGIITHVQGTGLLLAAELADGYLSTGRGSVEEDMRRHGIGVIHGGRNALRFTPHFAITSEEIDVIVSQLRDSLARAAD